MDGFDEHFPTELGSWLPAPRRPHVSEILPPRVSAPRYGGAPYVPVRPRLGLAEPPPLVRVRPFVRRSRAERVAMVLAALGTAAVAGAVLVAATGAAGVPHARPLGLAGFLAACMAVLGALAPRVSYRRRDGLLLLVPIVGGVVAVRVLWRLTALPDKNWRPRVDELAPALDPRRYADAAPEVDFWDRGE